jgi:NADPH:quinone reductase-like Zn-dependent oxidoreductase
MPLPGEHVVGDVFKVAVVPGGAGPVEGVDPVRQSRRVWVFNAQSYRPFGTAGQFTVVPSQLAPDLPDNVPDQVGACLGVPGITAHRAVFADGPVADLTLLVHGVLGVGRLAAQLAHWAAPPSSAPCDATRTATR